MHFFLVVSVVVMVLLLLFPVVLHRVYKAPRIRERSTPDDLGLVFQQQFIATAKSKKLFSWLIRAPESRSTLVIVHGWGGNAEMMLPLVRPFHDVGIDVLVYDARNHGNSDSDSFSSLPRFAEDLDHVIDWLKQKKPSHRIIVMGHSVGAAATILAASRRDDIHLAISIAGFAHPRLLMNRHLDRPWLPGIFRLWIINYIQWVIGFRFDDIAPMNRIANVQCPVLLAHGTADHVIPISDMHLIEANAAVGRTVKVLPVEGADHESVEHFQQHSDSLVSFINENLE